jgi:hypothetical protein
MSQIQTYPHLPLGFSHQKLNSYTNGDFSKFGVEKQSPLPKEFARKPSSKSTTVSTVGNKPKTSTNSSTGLRLNLHVHIHPPLSSSSSFGNKQQGSNPPQQQHSLPKGKEHISQKQQERKQQSLVINEDKETDVIVGHGGYGTVWSLRSRKTKEPLPEVLKISSFVNRDGTFDEEQFIVYEKEIEFLKLLQNITLPFTTVLNNEDKNNNNTDENKSTASPTTTIHYSIVPKLIDSWTNTSLSTGFQQGCQIMEKLDGNLTDLGLSQARMFHLEEGSFLFTPIQFRKVSEIPELLDSNDLIHGDLKPRNLVYLNGGHILKIIDGGFWGRISHYKAKAKAKAKESALSGASSISSNSIERKDKETQLSKRDTLKKVMKENAQIGYPDLPFCNAMDRRNPKNPPSFPLHLWPYLNKCQLCFAFTVNRKTYLLRENSKCELLPWEVVLMLFKLPTEYFYEFLALYDPRSSFSNTITQVKPVIALNDSKSHLKSKDARSEKTLPLKKNTRSS